MNSSQAMLGKISIATSMLIAGYLSLSGCDSSSNMGGKPVHDTHISVESSLTEAMAVEEARKACGISEAADTSSILIKNPGKVVPYVDPEKSVWRIRFKGVKFVLPKGGTPEVSSNITSLDVYVSLSTGHLIAAVSIWPDGMNGTRFPSIEHQEEQMKRISETFTGLPAAPPKLTLADAFQIHNHVSHAKQIIAYYVTVAYPSVPDSRPRSVWVIHAWGIPPFLPHGGTPELVSEDCRNHLRTEINADTGKWYGEDTIPQPSSSPTAKTYDQERP